MQKLEAEMKEFLRRYNEANATHAKNIGRIEGLRVEEALRYKRETSLIEVEIDAYVKSLTFSTLEETKTPNLALPREANLTPEEKCTCIRCDPTNPKHLVAYKGGEHISHDQFRREMLGKPIPSGDPVEIVPPVTREMVDEFLKSGSTKEKPSTSPD